MVGIPHAEKRNEKAGINDGDTPIYAGPYDIRAGT
jgi:hypothetical protein